MTEVTTTVRAPLAPLWAALAAARREVQPVERDRGALGVPRRVEGVRDRADHGSIDALGFRIGDVAYTPDVLQVPEESFEALEDLDVWVVDALRWTAHPSHANVERALGWIERAKPRLAILTNMHIDLDYEDLKAQLPAGVEPGETGAGLSM